MRAFNKILNILLVLVSFLIIVVFILYFKINSEFLLDSFIKRVQITSRRIINEQHSFKSFLGCNDKSFRTEKFQEGSYWILKNYIRAKHGELSCEKSVTYTTNGDYTFLGNLTVLIQRWKAPVSIALYAPGYDFNKTLEAIQYVRICLPESKLIEYFVTFHIYFENNHLPEYIPLSENEVLEWPYHCPLSPLYGSINQSSTYRHTHDLLYPINVGRNIARKAALTHFILAGDIELFPNPGFVKQFLEMIKRNVSALHRVRTRRVFPLVAFEIKVHAKIPETKTQLQALLNNKTAMPFHERICRSCHRVPNITEWLSANETDQLNVLAIVHRNGKYKYWEPFYVSDNQEPFFDERFSWEGQKNKRIQGFAMCLLNYEFHLLDNAFLVHSPGIKVLKSDLARQKHIRYMNLLTFNVMIPDYQILYGKRKGCDA